MEIHYFRSHKGDKLKQEILLSRPEQESWYKDCLNRVLDNPRWILDNLEYLNEFKVNWNNYSGKYIKHMCVNCGKKYPRTRREPCTCGCTQFRNIHYGVGYLKNNV